MPSELLPRAAVLESRDSIPAAGFRRSGLAAAWTAAGCRGRASAPAGRGRRCALRSGGRTGANGFREQAIEDTDSYEPQRQGSGCRPLPHALLGDDCGSVLGGVAGNAWDECHPHHPG